MGTEAKWEVNALLRDGDSLVPCNIQDAEVESGHYVWALPLDEVPQKPKTSLLGELLENEIDPATNLPIVKWCEWQPCLCDELGHLLDGHFCFVDDFADDEPDDGPNETPVDEHGGPSFPVMIQAADHEGVMLGEWDGERRDQDTGAPIVRLFAIRVRPDKG